MNLSFTKISYALLLGAAVILTGCGGSDSSSSGGLTYTGNTAPASINATNAEAIGVSTAEATTQAIATDNAQSNNPLAIVVDDRSRVYALIKDVSISAIKNATSPLDNLPVALTITSTQLDDPNSDYYDPNTTYCGGSLTVPDNASQNSFSITFNNLCINDIDVGQVTINGKIKISSTQTSFTMTFVNVTVTANGLTETLNASYSCTNINTATPSCSFSSTFVGFDGQTYQVSDYAVSGDTTTGFNIEATVSHPVHGTVTIQTTTPIMFCENGYPASGTITYTSEQTSGSITFLNCDSYEGTYNDGTSSGTFSGTWNAMAANLG